MNRVCAVVVTYDRRELLLRNIRSIKSQSVAADILVYNNASGYDVGSALSEAGYELRVCEAGDDVASEFSDADMVLFNSDVNRGGAGGFAEGIRYAYDSGHENIWLMDDDGYCLREDTLEILLMHLGSRKAIVNSLVLCAPEESGGDDLMSYSLFGQRYLKDIDPGIIRQHAVGDELHGEACTFNSTLFGRELVRDIGIVDQRFFIYGDDWDYLERAKEAGYDVITVPDSRYFHPDSGMGFFRVFGRIIDLREMTPENTYYYERNSAYIVRHYRSRSFAWLHVFKRLAGCLLYRRNRLKRTRAAVIGLLDGWHDRMDYSL